MERCRAFFVDVKDASKVCDSICIYDMYIYYMIYITITFIFFSNLGISSPDILENHKDQTFQRACNVEMS